MKLKIHPALNFTLLIAAVFLLALRLAAQPVIMNPQPYTPQTEAQQDAAPGPMDVFVPSTENVRPDLPDIFQYGWLNFRPHATYNFIYGSGIESSPSNQQNTVIQQLSPGVSLDLGRHFVLDYTPTIRFYSSKQFHDGVDQSASLSGSTIYNDWNFSGSQNFLYTTQPNAETGSQAEQESFATVLEATEMLNESMSLDFNFNQNILSAEQFESSRSWSTMNWLDYEFWPRLTGGIGFGGGYVNEDSGSDQFNEQLAAQLRWRALDKLSFQVTAGLQDQQYPGATSQTFTFVNITNSIATTNSLTLKPPSDLLTPTFSAAVQYQPFSDTQISLNASRGISPSLIAGYDSISTTVGIGISQILLKKFTLSLNAGYTVNDYTQTGIEIKKLSNDEYGPALSSIGRTDENYNFTARLSHPFLRRGTWGFTYQYSDNQSTAAGFTYESNQVGFDISYSY